MARILVTGAAGFAGSHLVQLLAGHEMFAWTRTTPPPSLLAHAHWQRVELMDRVAVRQAVEEARPTAVYHCAGSPHVATSWQDTAAPLAHNVIGTHHLLDALRLNGQPCRVLIPGSATVYASSATPIHEACAVSPSSPYALSKFAQERLGLRAIVEDGLEVVATRSFNHTGPGQTSAFVAPSMARQVARIERGLMEPILKVGNLDARRDFTDVRDVARAYALLVESGESGGIYNVASGVGRSMREILDAFLARARVPIRVDTDQARMRPHDTPVLIGDASKLRARTGWGPEVSFDRMIDDLLEHWRNEEMPSAEGGR